MAARICVVGSLNMDLVVQTPALPTPGQTLLGGPFATFPGGKGANQAVAAARAGGQATMIGCVGDDGYGTELRAGLAAEGIAVDAVSRRAGVASGVALITVAPDGQNTIVVAPGANGTLSTADVDQAASAITSADVLLLQLEVPLDVVQRAAETARRGGTIVVLNPAPAQPLPGELLQTADYVIPNESEADALTGIAVDDWSGAEQAARRLQNLGARSVLVTLGSRGALLLHAGEVCQIAPFAVDAVDATAAGDAFLGAFAVGLANRAPAREAARAGAAAGALAATRLGAQPSLPTQVEIAELLHMT